MDSYRVELLPPDEDGWVWERKEDFPKWAVMPLSLGRGRIVLNEDPTGYSSYY